MTSAPNRNVLRRNNISVIEIATRQTPENPARAAISFGNMAAFRAGLTGVSRINYYHHHAFPSRLVFDEATKFSKRPLLNRISLRPAKLSAFANAIQILNSNSTPAVFGLRNNTFA